MIFDLIIGLGGFVGGSLRTFFQDHASKLRAHGIWCPSTRLIGLDPDPDRPHEALLDLRQDEAFARAAVFFSLIHEQHAHGRSTVLMLDDLFSFDEGEYDSPSTIERARITLHHILQLARPCPVRIHVLFPIPHEVLRFDYSRYLLNGGRLNLAAFWHRRQNALSSYFDLSPMRQALEGLINPAAVNLCLVQDWIGMEQESPVLQEICGEDLLQELNAPLTLAPEMRDLVRGDVWGWEGERFANLFATGLFEETRQDIRTTLGAFASIFTERAEFFTPDVEVPADIQIPPGWASRTAGQTAHSDRVRALDVLGTRPGQDEVLRLLTIRNAILNAQPPAPLSPLPSAEEVLS